MLTRWAVLPPAGMVRLNAQRAIEKAVYRRCCRGQRRLDGTAGKGGAHVDTTQGRGERLDYAPAGCQPQRVSRAETSGSHERWGAVLWRRWEAGRMREGRGHPKPPRLSGSGSSAGSSCYRRLGRMQLRSLGKLGDAVMPRVLGRSERKCLLPAP